MNSTISEQHHQLVSPCQCQCGTRISLDEQLLNERQQWKSKYYCLQKQTTKDIGLLKEKIYQQCSTLMHQEFLSKQKNHAHIVNAKSIDVQQLTSRVIRLETACKIAEKQKEVLQRRLEEEDRRFAQMLEQLSELKSEHHTKVNRLHQNNLTETGMLKVRITEDYETKIQKLQKENEHLKHKTTELEKRYMSLIPEVEKLKSVIVKKTADVEGLEQQRQKMKQVHLRQVSVWRNKFQQLSQSHIPCANTISDLNTKIVTLQNQLTKARNTKTQIKVEPVYVDRPVEVQRVVEKLIQVQKIVKEYIEPSGDFRQVEEDNRRLQLELQNILHELRQFQNRYEQLVREHQGTVGEFEETVGKYKAEREGLVKKIHEQEEELERIFKMVESSQQYMGNECTSGGHDERIVVHVNKEGVVNKRVERIVIDERVKATVNRLDGGREPEGKRTEQRGKQQQQQPTTTTNYRATRGTTTQQVKRK